MDYKMEELLPVVKKLSEQYTSKESTSISYETANRLMTAVLYCLEEADRGDCGSYMVKKTAGVSAEEVYQTGYERLLQKVRRAREVYEGLAADFMSFGNRALDETVLKGIPAFFLYYDAKFDPENAVITMDYPVLSDMDGLRGGDAVCFYLDCIRLEQVFLKRFPEAVVREILISSQGDYEELFINLCGVILRRVLACMMLEKAFSVTPFSEEDYERLGRIVLKAASSSQDFSSQRQGVEALLFALLRQFTDRVFPDEPDLYSYLKPDIPNFAFELLNAAGHGSLDNLF